LSDKRTLHFNGQPVVARCGTTLAEAALSRGVVIPVDCSSGQCETCRVRVAAGLVDDAGTASGDTVLACQATVRDDAEITFDVLPVARRTRASITAIRPLAHDILEVVARTDEPLPYRPGQYVKVRFPGCPVRDYSPAAAPEGSDPESTLAFHIRLYDRGAVSAALRSRVAVGQRIAVEGSYGNAYHRPGAGRLVLVGTNTGWAPLSAIARAAAAAEPARPMRVVVGARDPRHLYMRAELARLEALGADVTLVCSGGAGDGSGVRQGRPTAFIGSLAPDDVVYAAGAPEMVESVRILASAAGAPCYVDPFTVGTGGPSLFGRIRMALETGDEARLRPGRAAPAALPEPGYAGGPARAGGEAPRRGGVLTRWFARS
jgi:3-phenylpropionate/trans-cinnamate dioxygenase ferredoxin reductase subunit